MSIYKCAQCKQIPLSSLIDFREQQEKTSPGKDNPLGRFHIDFHMNCINRKSYPTQNQESMSASKIYTDERDLLVSISSNGKIDKFAIVDKPNINRRLLPGLFRVGNIKDENNVPFVWNILQANCVKMQIGMLPDAQLETESYKSIFDQITIQELPNRIFQLNLFMYSLACIASSGYTGHHLPELKKNASNILSREQTSYFSILHKLELLGSIAYHPSHKTFIISDSVAKCDDVINSISCYKIETVNIATINNRVLMKKIVDSSECIIPIEIFEHKPANIQIIREILKIVRVRHVFVEKGLNTTPINTELAHQSLFDLFGDTVEHINYCKIGEDIETFNAQLKDFKKTKINNVSILSNLLLEIANLKQKSFKYKSNDSKGSKVPLSKDDLFIFYKIRDSILRRAYELQLKVPVEEYYYQDVLLYKLRALEEEMSLHMQTDAWQLFMLRQGEQMKGNNFARTIKKYTKEICFFRHQLPILHEYIKEKGWIDNVV